MEELGLLITKTYGIAGLIMLSPFAMLVFLWRHYVHTVNSHKKDMATKDAIIEKLSEARTTDAQKVSDKLIDMSKVQSEYNKETNMALERVGDLMSLVATPQPRLLTRGSHVQEEE